MSIFRKTTVVAGLLASGNALAHPGDHGYSGFLHFFTQPDHLLMLAVAGVAGSIALIKMTKMRKDRS